MMNYLIRDWIQLLSFTSTTYLRCACYLSSCFRVSDFS